MNGGKFQHKSSFFVGETNVIIGHKSKMTYSKLLVSGFREHCVHFLHTDIQSESL